MNTNYLTKKTGLIFIGVLFLTLGIFYAVMAAVLTETILRRELVIVPRDQKIIELQSELIVNRSLRTADLTGKSWAEYKKEAYKFPLLQSVPPSYNKRNIDWTLFDFSVMSNFIAVATDNSVGVPFEILVHKNMTTNNPEGIFLIRQHFDSNVDALYGPFFDNVARIKTAIKDFRITNIGDANNLGDAVTSVFPVYAFGCDIGYSKIDFFIIKDIVKAPTVLLGSTPGGSAGSGECDLLENESSLNYKLTPGEYRIWAVRYIDNVADKRTSDVKFSIILSP